MKVGQDLAQQLNAMPEEQVKENAEALLDGLKSSVISVLFEAAKKRLSEWIANPANQQIIMQYLLEALQAFFKPKTS